MLKHLIIYPRGGLCNKFRFIFSGLRLSEQYDIPLDILFPEGDLQRLILLPACVTVIQQLPDLSGYTRIACSGKRCVFNFSKMEKVFCEGLVRFRNVSRPKFSIYMYADYIKPSSEVLERVEYLKDILHLPENYIGMHIRRGDHKKCIAGVPDKLVLKTIESTLATDRNNPLLIACEDIALRERLESLYGERVIIASSKKQHWVGNSKLSLETAIDDYAELLLLSQGRYVIGTGGSSYSRMAISCNRSRKSFLMGKNTGLHV